MYLKPAMSVAVQSNGFKYFFSMPLPSTVGCPLTLLLAMLAACPVASFDSGWLV